MTDTDDLKLAKRIKQHYKRNPDHEIDHVANIIGETPEKITFILDEFRVDKNGEVNHVGPGSGGGWVSNITKKK